MYSIEKTKGINILRYFDYTLFIPVFLLSLFGLVILYSATLSRENGSSELMKQVIALFLGVVLALIISVIDYKDFKNLGTVLYLISVFLLILVLIFGIGYQQVGTKGWLNFKGFNLQPSEIAKITFVMVTSIFFERLKDGEDDRKNNTIKLVAYSIIPIVLVLAQPDAGTAMVFMFMLFAMLFIYGIKYKYILYTAGAFVLSTPLLWFFVLKPHQKNRIITFLFPELDPMNTGYHVMQSKRAIGSGQTYGKGLFEGFQTQNGIVPEKHTDFIFTVIGEELGLIGTVLVVVLIFSILIRCIYIAKNAMDSYGSFLVIGLTAMMGFHFIENIGMCIGLLPVTGIPLPFISYGGSSLITNYIALGLILSVSIRRKRNIFNASQ